MIDVEKRRIIEHQKAMCRSKIEFHTKNVILQSMVSFLCVTGAFYASQKRNIIVPLVLAPSAACSISKGVTHETKRRYYKKRLNSLERY